MRGIYACSVAAALMVSCPREPSTGVRVDDPASWDRDLALEVAQPSGRLVHWVLPGKRDLSLVEFGTPAEPRSYGDGGDDADLQALIERWPWLVGVPVALRNRTPDGRRWLDTRVDVPWGGPLEPVVGEVHVAVRDRWIRDRGLPHSADQARVQARFSDPGGRLYQVSLERVVEAPFPEWETAGGVLVDQPVFGVTGTGTPLMPEVHAWVAIWGLANVSIDGQVVGTELLTSVVVHQNAHDEEGRLVQTLELPLDPEDTLSGHPYHLRLAVLPLRQTAEGLVFSPPQRGHRLPGGLTQGFIHVVFEQPSVVQGPPFTRPREGQALFAE